MAVRGRLMERLVAEGAVSKADDPASRPPPRTSPPAGRVPHWIMAVALMGLLHAFWWLWLSPSTDEPVFRPRPGPRWAYLSPDLAPDTRGAWFLSPALTALLDPHGLADPVFSDQLSGQPDLEAPRVPLSFLERGEYRADAGADLVEETALPTFVGPWSAPSPLERTAIPSVVTLVPAEHLEGLRIALLDGLRREDLAGIEVPGGLPLDDRMVWDASAWLEFASSGVVDHVFLEETSGDSDRDRDLLRSLYRWRISPGTESRQGRVRISFFRRADEAAAAARGVP